MRSSCSAIPGAYRDGARRAPNDSTSLGEERDTLMLLDRLRTQPALAGGDKAALRAERVLIAKGARLARKADKVGAKLHARGA